MSDLNPLCLYIHGFGGISYEHAFTKRLSEEFRELNFSCSADTHAWRSPTVTFWTTSKDWNDAKSMADAESEVLLKEKIYHYEESNRPYYVIGFSLGCRVLAEALRRVQSPLKNCRGVYLIEAAIPKSTILTLDMIPQDVPIRNYFSPRFDKILAYVYRNSEGEPAAGQVGMYEQKRVENMNVGLSHLYGATHIRMARGLGQLIAYEQGNRRIGRCLPNVRWKVRDKKTWWAEIVRSEQYSWQQNMFAFFGQFRVVELKTKQRMGWAFHLHPLLDTFANRSGKIE